DSDASCVSQTLRAGLGGWPTWHRARPRGTERVLSILSILGTGLRVQFRESRRGFVDFVDNVVRDSATRRLTLASKVAHGALPHHSSGSPRHDRSQGTPDDTLAATSCFSASALPWRTPPRPAWGPSADISTVDESCAGKG